MLTQNQTFALRMATFNALGFCATTAGITFTDSQLVNAPGFPDGRHYPLGYWVCLMGILVFFAVYYFIMWPSRRIPRLLLAPLAVLFCTALVLPNFKPFPHGAVFFWLILYFIATIVSLGVHLHTEEQAYLDDESIDSSAKVERIKASLSLWRTLLTGLAIGYVGLIATWGSNIIKLNELVTTDNRELNILNTANFAGVVLYSAFFIGGPLWELYLKMRETAGLFLRIKCNTSIHTVSLP